MYGTDHDNSPVVASFGEYLRILAMFIFLNIITMFLGIYSIQQLTKTKFPSFESASIKILNDTYWSVACVTAAVNFACFYYESKYVYFLWNRSFPFLFRLSTMLLIFIFEVPSVYYVIKDFKLSASVCCCSRPGLIRAAHTLALCHMLWFIHRVGCCFIVSIFSLAIAPAQTLATISFLLTIILCSIFSMALIMNMVRHCRHNYYRYAFSNCALFLKIFLIFSFYVSFSLFIVSFFFIFLDLLQNGLSSSTIGSIMLSLFAPLILLIISFAVKKYLKMNNFKITNTTGDQRNVRVEYQSLE